MKCDHCDRAATAWYSFGDRAIALCGETACQLAATVATGGVRPTEQLPAAPRLRLIQGGQPGRAGPRRRRHAS